MKRIFTLLLVLLSGCAAVPNYNYQSQASTDPEIIFGDRFGGGSVSSPARSFTINTKDAVANRCADFDVVGTTSNHWMKISPPTIQIKTPAGKAVAIKGSYMYSSGYSMTTCTPPTLTFIPKDAATYSVDVSVVQNKCLLSVVQKLADGQPGNVEGLAPLPNCIEK